MKIVLPLITAAVVLAFASCAAPGTEAEPVAAGSTAASVTDDLWNFSAAADSIRAASCPDSNAPMRGFLPPGRPMARPSICSARMTKGATFCRP